jgi:hypothetical protein
VGSTEFQIHYTSTTVVLTRVALPANHFSVSAPPSSTAGAPFNITVTALDQLNATVPGYRGTVHFTSTDSQAMLPTNYTFTAADNGVHTFTNGVTLNTTGSQAVTATDTVTSLITGSATVSVNPAMLTHFGVSASASSSTAGAPFSVTVYALDQTNHYVPSYRGTVHFTSTDSQATLPADYTFTAADPGWHTFTNVVTLRTAGSQSVTATDTVTSSITGSGTVSVSPAAATHLGVTGVSNVTAGSGFTLRVTALDPFNNVDNNYRGTVTFTSSDGQAALPANYTFSFFFDHGVHDFFNGATLRTAGSQTITVTDTVTSSITGSASSNVAPAALDHFQITAPPSSTAGSPFNITVIAQDRFNNTVTGYTGTVTFSSQDPFGATLPAAYTFTAGAGGDNGVHTFPGGATLFTAGTRDVTATDTSSGLGGSANVVVTPAAAVRLVLTAPAQATSGAPFDLTVTAVDPFGNTDTNYQGTVTFSSSDTDPGVVLPPAYTFQASDHGTVTFAGAVTLITSGDQTIFVTDLQSGITGFATVTL